MSSNEYNTKTISLTVLLLAIEHILRSGRTLGIHQILFFPENHFKCESHISIFVPYRLVRLGHFGRSPREIPLGELPRR